MTLSMFVPLITRRSKQVRATRRLDESGDVNSEVGIGHIRAGVGGGGGRSGSGGGSSGGGGRSGGSSVSRSGGSSGPASGRSGGSSGGRLGGVGKSGGRGWDVEGGEGEDGDDEDGESDHGADGSSSRSISTGSGGRSATTLGKGGGPVIVIPNGQSFSGRSAGGGTRGQIYGTSQYGSGYPGISGRGTSGRGFPFFFWPVTWGRAYDDDDDISYLNPPDYGLPTNTSRPGGPLATAAFPSSNSNTTFRLLSDNQTVVALIEAITNICSSDLQNASAITSIPYNSSTSLPKPEQAIQYYRASSIVLTLDGYNNTGDFSSNGSVFDMPLPSNIDHNLLDCMNFTIGATAPLVNASNMMRTTPTSGLLGLAWIIWMLLSSS